MSQHEPPLPPGARGTTPLSGAPTAPASPGAQDDAAAAERQVADGSGEAATEIAGDAGRDGRAGRARAAARNLR
ncbi:hypothetical protein CR162_10205 [Pseudoroseomonas rhizosphaerae]|uniref:Uncharacterized protein n=1 Tax=Teichococcus rhizosphaerae TaxID=1335062 RepID=A0A2C7AAN5_9PROT|nr:hypothetical protein [Pseudoroseomonas rhizosphaerae]PHK95109.1 hypothetical protein CR162_10205 [Pseudoroseomonas rhizosphaerae]